MTVRLLVVQHQADCPPGRVGAWLREEGARLDVVRPDLGMPLPDSLTGYAGLLVLGGSLGAHDDEAGPWLRRTKELLRAAVDASLPTLGICLGHQLLAVACDGRVERNPAGRRMGNVKLDLTVDSLLDPLFSQLPWPAVAPRWHQDIVVAAPPDAVVLATADENVVQAIRVGETAWGIQAHPEATVDVVEKWATRTVEGGVENPLAVKAAVRTIRNSESLVERTWRKPIATFASLLFR